MSIVAIVAIIIAVAIVAVLAYAATRPDAFQVQRTASIKAPPERIFPLIDDLHAHTTWSPFEKDPNMKRTHSGAPRGKGAIYDWEGNSQVGSGRLAITDSTPSKITMALDMFRPFKAHNTVEFSLQPNQGWTNVTWQMHGRQPFMAKLMSMFIDCDKMVGKQFEEGLGKMKALAEKA
jgi:Polyketide cyclase / dehydrase and lipid transport